MSRSKDLESFENYRKTSENRFYRTWDYIYYTDEEGKTVNIFGEKLSTLSEEEQAKIIDSHLRYCYNHELSNTFYRSRDPETLNEEGKRKFSLLRQIVGSFNRDESNGMIDYFARSIYDDYCFKIVD